jgi:hypothetical protein
MIFGDIITDSFSWLDYWYYFRCFPHSGKAGRPKTPAVQHCGGLGQQVERTERDVSHCTVFAWSCILVLSLYGFFISTGVSSL